MSDEDSLKNISYRLHSFHEESATPLTERHEHDDKDHAHSQERQRLDIRQAIAGAYEAGAPKQDENDRSSRNRQLGEAR